MSSKIESLKSKIAALLAKAERTDNEHERDAFNAKAEKLMLAYGIEAAELEAAGEVKPEQIIVEGRGYRGGYAIVMPEFIYVVSRALGHLRVVQSDGPNTRYVRLIGHESDVAAAWTLIDSLEKQAHIAMKRWVRDQNADPTSIYKLIPGPEKFKSRREYITGFALGAGKRIDEEKRDVDATATASAALVLVSKAERLSNFMDDEYGHLKPAKDRRATGITGRGAGYTAGQQANVGTTQLPSARKGLN